MKRILMAAIVTLCLVSPAAHGQAPNAAWNHDAMKAMAADVAALTKGNSVNYEREMVKRIKANPSTKTFRLVSLPFLGAWSFRVTVTGPVGRYVLNTADAIRRLEPWENTAWTEGIHVSIAALTVDAPNIEKVVVTRNGQIIEPRENGLKLEPNETRMGVKFNVNEGTVVFDPAAFAPVDRRESLKLILIPTRGRNYELNLAQALVLGLH